MPASQGNTGASPPGIGFPYSPPPSSAPNAVVSRFRSFAERYVVERAGSFTTGMEREQAWSAIQDAKTIYGMIATADNPSPEMQQMQAYQQGIHGPQGATSQSPAPRNAARVIPAALAVPPNKNFTWFNKRKGPKK